MRAALVLVAALLALLAGGAAQAQSPLAAELRAFASRYHEDPPRLDALYAGLTEAVKTDSHLDNLLALAQAAFIWGDIRARTAEDKLGAYERGRQAGQRAVELAPRNALAHLWLAINAGRWGQTKGVLRSLFLLPTVREHMEAALELDPRLLPAYTLAGTVYAEVPGLFGGDLEKSEALFRKGLALDASLDGRPGRPRAHPAPARPPRRGPPGAGSGGRGARAPQPRRLDAQGLPRGARAPRRPGQG